MKNGVNIYVDTNIFIYLLENHTKYANKIANFFSQQHKNKASFITSAITITELVAGNPGITPKMLNSLPGLQIIQVNEEIALKAGILQNNDAIKIGDSIHLASAILSDCDSLYTNDTKLIVKAKGILKTIKP